MMLLAVARRALFTAGVLSLGLGLTQAASASQLIANFNQSQQNNPVQVSHTNTGPLTTFTAINPNPAAVYPIPITLSSSDVGVPTGPAFLFFDNVQSTATPDPAFPLFLDGFSGTITIAAHNDKSSPLVIVSFINAVLEIVTPGQNATFHTSATPGDTTITVPGASPAFIPTSEQGLALSLDSGTNTPIDFTSAFTTTFHTSGTISASTTPIPPQDAVPEPATLGSGLLAALLGIAGLRRARKA